jgi:hypothetical protein
MSRLTGGASDGSAALRHPNREYGGEEQRPGMRDGERY